MCSALLPLVAAIGFLLITACQREPQSTVAPAGSASPATTSAPTAAEREVELVVEGMDCATCTITVRTAAKAVPGVVDARVTTDPGRALVRYRPAETDPGRIAAAITESGYAAHEASR